MFGRETLGGFEPEVIPPSDAERSDTARGNQGRYAEQPPLEAQDLHDINQTLTAKMRPGETMHFETDKGEFTVGRTKQGYTISQNGEVISTPNRVEISQTSTLLVDSERDLGEIRRIAGRAVTYREAA